MRFIMSQSVYQKRAKKEATQTFAWYVFFHSVWSSVFKFFSED